MGDVKISRVPLQEPFWKHRAFGIPIDQLQDYEVVETECSYRNKKGVREFPYLYRINCKEALSRNYMQQKVKSGRVLVIIPIKDWETVSRES